MYKKLFFVFISGMSKSNFLENFNFFLKDYDSDVIYFIFMKREGVLKFLNFKF